ncbi:MAG: pseudouridine synthase [Acidobacteria bacterium]|nr:MAG: pseudouridine synthase [Acidobacteriota bacterium]
MTLVFNKPYGVLCQFTDEEGRPTLADFIRTPNVYAAGRLDFDSEGLVVLTDDGRLQHALAGQAKTYLVQLDRGIDKRGIDNLRKGVRLKDGLTKPAIVEMIDEPKVWPRNPPVRFRKNVPTSWISLTITEGRNRQVRRMTAAVGFPTLRLIRVSVGPYQLGSLQPGESRSHSSPASPRSGRATSGGRR